MSSKLTILCAVITADHREGYCQWDGHSWSYGETGTVEDLTLCPINGGILAHVVFRDTEGFTEIAIPDLDTFLKYR